MPKNYSDDATDMLGGAGAMTGTNIYPSAKESSGRGGVSGQRWGPSDIFPRWLLREVEFRQLVHAHPAALERRREEAAAWIKQEVVRRVRYRCSQGHA